MLLPQRQPGGWSARGQPCDAIHSLLRKYIATYMDTILGYRGRLVDRASQVPLLMSNGNRHLSVSHEEACLACVYGFKRLGKSRHVLRQGERADL